jgi:hypothetical protein
VSVEGSALEAVVPEIDTSKPHPARMYDYYLGGKNHFAADRETAEKGLASWRSGRVAARENRAFLGRAVRFLATGAGIRQFLDIGTGLPTTNNVHEVAQAVAPSSRVVYADNDPLVLAHARALLTRGPHRLHQRRPARPAINPVRPIGPGGPGLQPADRADARRRFALHA